ncbi:MAG: hypothetical protein ACLGHC_01090 [Alphaproteobacteria bacterium]
MAKFDANVAAILAFAVVQQLVEKLARKSALTVEEGTDIYRQALDALEGEHRDEARRIIAELMPHLKV